MNVKKMKLKRSTEIRRCEDFTPDEIDEIKNIKAELQTEDFENLCCLGFTKLTVENGKEETSV